MDRDNMHLPLHCPRHSQYLQPSNHHTLQHTLPIIRLGSHICRDSPTPSNLPDIGEIRRLHPSLHNKLHARRHVRLDELGPMAQSYTENDEPDRCRGTTPSSGYLLSHRSFEGPRLCR